MYIKGAKKANKLYYEGKVFKNHNNEDFIVITYVNNINIPIRFLDTGYETIARTETILSGRIKDKLKPSVYGAGIIGDEPVLVGGKPNKEYCIWASMLKRCYSDNYKQANPSYEDCTVSDNFKVFKRFKDWRNKQIGFNSVDEKGRLFNLDKDILIKGNKVYSEATCCFVPQEINNLFVKNTVMRGNYLIGVSYQKRTNKYVSHIVMGNKLKSLGSFYTELEAFEIYKATKEKFIKEIANKWKDQIDHRVYNALMKYEVEITD